MVLEEVVKEEEVEVVDGLYEVEVDVVEDKEVEDEEIEEVHDKEVGIGE